MTPLVFITSNAGKAKTLSDYFDMPVEHLSLDLPEVQSLNLRDVVTAKATAAYEVVQRPVLVEDVALTFAALAPLPGPLIKWFLEALGNEGLCRLLDRLDDRRAHAEVQFCLCDGGETHVFSGARSGTISPKPRGAQGFGWDPIFIPEGSTRTWAEMTDDEKHATSMRRLTLEALKTYLRGRSSA